MKKKSKPCVLGIFAALSLLGSASAAACEIEDWRYTSAGGKYVEIEGTTTCESGQIRIRVYDGSGNYLGNANGFIQGYSFSALVQANAPNRMEIKYSISQ